jgi:riboflavin kinase/FMN adenylyltransferase
MLLIRHLDDLPSELTGGAVAIGNFDGVHVGHAAILGRLKAAARRLDGPSIVFTFDPHPVRLLRPQAAPAPLTWSERKAVLIERLGVAAMLVYPTDESLLRLTAEQFFADIVRKRLQTRGMVEGPNFFFGRDRGGDIRLLRNLCEAAGIELEVVEPRRIAGQYVSSSRVRQLIVAGQVADARQMLTEPYRIRGMVTHGAGRGAKIGFPTANVSAVDTLLPAHGVYAGRAYLNGSCWPAAINIGTNPTFGEDSLKVEAHLLDFDQSLYGQPLEVDFLERLRDTRPFQSVEELKRQLHLDVEQAGRVTE